MIYIKIHAEDIDEVNQWVRDNIDHGAGDSFIVNKQDPLGSKFCLISLPDNDSNYNKALIAQFGKVKFAKEDPGKRDYAVDEIVNGAFITKGGKSNSRRGDKLADISNGVV